MNKKDIQKAIAKECIATGNEGKDYIVSAYTAYCIALKSDGKKVPLWTVKGTVQGVHKQIELLGGVKHP